jgi:spore coat protein U-like protein
MSGSYGVVDILSGAVDDSSTTFTVNCTGILFQTVRVCIEVGNGTAPCNTLNGNLRRLCSNANLLEHSFFTDAGRTTNWGSWGSVVGANGSGGVTADIGLNVLGSGSQSFTVYSRVSANQQTVPTGSYTWTTTSPGLRYGYKGSTSCPTGGATAVSSGSTWTATVNDNCNISTSSMNFGSTGSNILSNVDATATITAQCTNTTVYSIGLTNGSNAVGSQNRMRLGATSSYVNYDLYTDVARATAWATTSAANSCTSGTGTCVLGTGTGNNQSITVYGRVPPQTITTQGSYSDVVVVTVTF